MSTPKAWPARSLVRKAWYADVSPPFGRLTKVYRKRCYRVPLQVHHDAQVVNSRYGSNEPLIPRC